MSPLERRPENRGLPARWTWKNGAIYYIVPPAVKDQWEGKVWYRLGGTLAEAYRTWTERQVAPVKHSTIGDLLDRYLIEAVPGKAPKTQTENRRQIQWRAVLGSNQNREAAKPVTARICEVLLSSKRQTSNSKRENMA